MFQVLHSEKPLYVQAGNCVEASEWVEVLSQVSRCNPDRLGTFHPSAYVAGAWLCCRSLSDSQPGCKPCTP
jgi:Ras GTPase-activating protein 2